MEGAVYTVAAPFAVDAGETEPHGAVEHDTAQLTPLLLTSFATVAENACVPSANTAAELGDTETVTPRTGMVPELDIEEFATEVALNVTVSPAGGTLAGAVKVVAAPL